MPQRTPAKQYHRAHQADRRDQEAPTNQTDEAAPNARAPAPSTITAGMRKISFHVPNASGMGTPMCAIAPLAKKHEISDEERVKNPIFAVRPRSPSRRSLGCRLVPHVILLHRTCGPRRWTGAHYDAQLG